MDTLYNQHHGPYIQTFFFQNTGLMIGFLHQEKTSEAMASHPGSSSGASRHRLFPAFFPDPHRPWADKFEKTALFEQNPETGQIRTNLFYCDPQMPSQKPHVENNQSYVRDILPNRQDLKHLTQQELELMFSHINSVPRKVLGGRTPYDVFSFFYGEKLLHKLGIRRIEPDSVNLQPYLLKIEKSALTADLFQTHKFYTHEHTSHMYSLGQRNFVFHKKRKRFLCSTLHAQKSGTVFKVYTKNAVQARKNFCFLSENRSFSFIWMLLLQPDVTFSIHQIFLEIFLAQKTPFNISLVIHFFLCYNNEENHLHNIIYPQEKERKRMERQIIQVEDKVPVKLLIPLSIQHMFAMFGASVLVPFLFGINPAIVLLMNGIGTLLFILITKGKAPAYLGLQLCIFITWSFGCL